MYLPSGQYAYAYQQIVARARGQAACSTFLLVAPDVDALCAARLLSALLKTDDVPHQTVPVGSWAQLAEEAQQLRDEEVRPSLLSRLAAGIDRAAHLASFIRRRRTRSGQCRLRRATPPPSSLDR